jgi:hypothetical protein
MAQTMPALTTLHDFTGQSADGTNPESALAIGTGGVLYGVTYAADAVSSMVETREYKRPLIILDPGLSAAVIERTKAVSARAVVPIIVVSARDVHASKWGVLKPRARSEC